MEDLGIGLMLDSLCVTFELLQTSLTQVLEDSSFRETIARIRRQTLDSRMTPDEACGIALGADAK